MYKMLPDVHGQLPTDLLLLFVSTHPHSPHNKTLTPRSIVREPYLHLFLLAVLSQDSGKIFK